MDIQDFDEHKLRGLCPVHNENTPSFIWNKDGYYFKCFGCGKTIDLIDAYLMTGLTFTEAVECLFKEADIDYSFSEHGIKTNREHRYPYLEPDGELDKILPYLNVRKISKETADYLDLRQDKYGNVVFNYYDLNDVLTMVKYRPSHKIDKSKKEPKNWIQKDSDRAWLLFNMNRINVDNPLLICCGELDCAAAIESGYLNTVSIPLGDGNTEWIRENFDWLEQFDDIILCPDNDKAGDKFKKEVISRLGSWKCRVVEVPHHYEQNNGTKINIKDLNEVLYWFGKEKVMSIILEAKDTPVPSVVDFSDIKDVDLNDIDGVQTGFSQLDKELMRLFYGNLNIVTGLPGSGKTSLLYQIVCEALEQDINTWIFSRELPAYQSKNWINFIMAGRHNLNKHTSNTGSNYWTVTESAKSQINKYCQNKLFIYKDDYDNTIETILESMEDSCRKNGVKFFIIDNMMSVNLHSGENNKLDKQTEFISSLISFAQKFNVCVILVAHPRKTQNISQLTKFDIAGSSNIINLAHRSLTLRRIDEKEKQSKGISFDCVLTVLKDRQRGREGFELGFYFDEQCRRFYSNKKEFNRQYKWDKKHYNELQYPPDQYTNEAFGKMGE